MFADTFWCQMFNHAYTLVCMYIAFVIVAVVTVVAMYQ